MSSDYTPVLSCDFDGTLCEYDFPRCGPPKEDVIRVLQKLERLDWRIIIYSARTNAEWHPSERRVKTIDMFRFLQRHSIPFHAVWGVGWGTRKHSWRKEPYTPVGANWYWRDDIGKPVAHVYLEDRAVLPQGRTERLLDACVSLAEDVEQAYQKGMEAESQDRPVGYLKVRKK